MKLPQSVEARGEISPRTAAAREGRFPLEWRQRKRGGFPLNGCSSPEGRFPLEPSRTEERRPGEWPIDQPFVVLFCLCAHARGVEC